LEHPFDLADRHAETTAYSDDGNFTASGSGVARVFGKVEIALSGLGHRNRLWSFVFHDPSCPLWILPIKPLQFSIVTDIQYIQHKDKTPMAQIAIDLDWVRDPEGYRLVERKRELWVVRKGKNHPRNLPRYRPLASTDLLFKIFANKATKPEGVLDFVQNYGLLTYGGWDTTGDQVRLVTLHASHMQQVLRYWSDGSKQRDWPLVPQTGSSISLNAMVVWDFAAKALKWEFRPNTLLDALWLQLGQALTGSAQIRQCEHCGDWFEAGRGTGRRLDAKFCSDEHRITFNSLKRSREK
jgi:hypothetical protein